jgi:hypothetical protein
VANHVKTLHPFFSLYIPSSYLVFLFLIEKFVENRNVNVHFLCSSIKRVVFFLCDIIIIIESLETGIYHSTKATLDSSKHWQSQKGGGGGA